MRGGWKVRPSSDRAELVEHRVHQARVERVADRQPRGLAFAPLRLRAPSISVGGAGDDDRARPVDRGEVDGRSGSGRPRPRWPRSRASRRRRAAHPSAGRGRRPARTRPASESTPATCAAAISPTEWPITTSGVIPIDSSSRNSATSKREQRRLGVLGPVEPVPARTSVLCRPEGRCVQDLVQRLGEHRERLVQLAPMPARCEPWPANRKRGPCPSPGVPVHERRRRPARRGARTARASCASATATSPSGTSGCSRQPVPQAVGLAAASAVRGLGRDAPAAAAAAAVHGLDLGRRRLLEDHVGVGAADPERGDAGAPGALGPRPGLGRR